MATHVPTNLQKYSSTSLFPNSRFLASPQHSRYMNYSNLSNVLSPLHTNALRSPQRLWYTQALCIHTPSFSISQIRIKWNLAFSWNRFAVTLRNQASGFGKQLILQEVRIGWKCWQGLKKLEPSEMFEELGWPIVLCDALTSWLVHLTPDHVV